MNINPLSLKFRIYLAVLIGLLFAEVSLFAAGRSPLPILRTVMDPRRLALGAANESEAGLIRGELDAQNRPWTVTRNFGSSFARHQLDLWSGNCYYTQKLRDNLLFSGELSIFDYGQFERSQRNIGFNGEKFQAAEYSAIVKLGGKIQEFLHGAAGLNYAWGVIDESSAKALTLEGGLSLDPDPRWYNFQFGLAVKHYPLTLKGYDEQTPGAPTELVLGLSRRLRHLPLTIYAAGRAMPPGDGDYRLELPSFFSKKGKVKLPADGCFSLGGEFEIKPQNQLGKDSKTASAPLYLRFGYDSKAEGLRMGQRLDLLAGVSFGLGIRVRAVGIDYAYAPLGALGDVHRVGIGIMN